MFSKSQAVRFFSSSSSESDSEVSDIEEFKVHEEKSFDNIPAGRHNNDRSYNRNDR